MSHPAPVPAPTIRSLPPLRALASRLGGVDGGMWVSLAFCLPALAPLARPGFGDMADASVHVFRTVELARLWGDGVVYSRWAPDLAFGLGYPLFNFYAPLFYYLAAGFTLIGLDFEAAVKATLALAVLAGSAGTYALARQWTGPLAAVLAAIAFTWAPYRLRELYFQGDFAQGLALAFLPIVLWAMHRLATTGRDRYLAGLALSVAGLLLSHSITTMLSSPFIAGYLLLLPLCLPATRRHWPRLALGLALGAGLSAFFFLPALGEMSLVRLDQLHSGDFDFRRHFAPAGELFSLPVPIDTGVVNPEVRYSFGLAQGLAALPSLLALRAKRLRWAVAMGWLGLGGCVLLMLPQSTPLWQAIPLLGFAEFPTRWLGVGALPLGMLAALALEAMPRPARAAYLVLVALAIFWSTSPHLYPREPFTRFDQATVADLVRYELESQAIGTTSAGEYLPRGIGAVPRTSPLVGAYLEGATPDRLDRAALPAGATATAVDLRSLSPRWQIDSPAPFTARVYTLNFPGWVAYLDGAPSRPGTTSPEGYIAVAVPAGRHELSLRFEDTESRRLANGVSAVFALALAGAVLARGGRARARSGAAASADAWPDYGGARDRLSRRLTLGLVAGALALVAVKAVYIDPYTALFRAASSPDSVPGLERRLDVNFADEVSLLGYSVDRQVAAPGETIRVVLYWRALRPLQRTYASFLHLGDERDDKVVQKDSPLPAQVAMQRWRPDQFARDEHLLVLPADMPPGIYQFRAGLYDPGSSERLGVKDSPANFVLLDVPLRVAGDPPPAASRTAYGLGGAIRLLGYHIPRTTLRPGEEATVHLYWQAREALDTDYTVFVHLYDRAGKLWGAGDSLPLGGKYPTSQWTKGEVVGDAQRVRLDSQAPPGEYTLAVGLYDLKTMQRLPVTGEDGRPVSDNAIRLLPAVQAVGP